MIPGSIWLSLLRQLELATPLTKTAKGFKGHAVVIHGEVKPPLGGGTDPRVACACGILQ